VQTPTLDRLAAGGLRYNRFHVTALCSPTRMALLTGRNHHSAGMGSVTEIATGFFGNNAVRPDNVAPLAEMLRLNRHEARVRIRRIQPTWKPSMRVTWLFQCTLVPREHSADLPARDRRLAR
jgi:hypothetical protein